MSLLSDAKKVATREHKETKFTSEDEELVYAWVNSEITMKQLLAAKKLGGSGQGYIYIARVCRHLFSENGKKR